MNTRYFQIRLLCLCRRPPAPKMQLATRSVRQRRKPITVHVLSWDLRKSGNTSSPTQSAQNKTAVALPKKRPLNLMNMMRRSFMRGRKKTHGLILKIFVCRSEKGQRGLRQEKLINFISISIDVGEGLVQYRSFSKNQHIVIKFISFCNVLINISLYQTKY